MSILNAIPSSYSLFIVHFDGKYSDFKQFDFEISSIDKFNLFI